MSQRPNHPGLLHVTESRIAKVRRWIASDYGENDYRLAYQLGIRAAAEFAGSFDAQVDHPYRMEEVVLAKFNLIKGRPRRKKLRGAQNDRLTPN